MENQFEVRHVIGEAENFIRLDDELAKYFQGEPVDILKLPHPKDFSFELSENQREQLEEEVMEMERLGLDTNDQFFHGADAFELDDDCEMSDDEESDGDEEMKDDI